MCLYAFLRQCVQHDRWCNSYGVKLHHLSDLTRCRGAHLAGIVLSDSLSCRSEPQRNGYICSDRPDGVRQIYLSKSSPWLSCLTHERSKEDRHFDQWQVSWPAMLSATAHERGSHCLKMAVVWKPDTWQPRGDLPMRHPYREMCFSDCCLGRSIVLWEW